MNYNRPELIGHSAEAELSVYQLDLPLGRMDDARPDLWVGVDQWPSPNQVLAGFLELIGISQPDRVAGSLIREFGSLDGALAASWWRLRPSVGSG